MNQRLHQQSKTLSKKCWNENQNCSYQIPKRKTKQTFKSEGNKIQGVPQNSLRFLLGNLLAHNAPKILIFDIFQQPFPSAVEKYQRSSNIWWIYEGNTNSDTK